MQLPNNSLQLIGGIPQVGDFLHELNRKLRFLRAAIQVVLDPLALEGRLKECVLFHAAPNSMAVMKFKPGCQVVKQQIKNAARERVLADVTIKSTVKEESSPCADNLPSRHRGSMHRLWQEKGKSARPIFPPQDCYEHLVRKKVNRSSGKRAGDVKMLGMCVCKGFAIIRKEDQDKS
eukprot:Skav205013  [mRNA]  locus=scaffold2134:157808:160827:+ [translate_table: standard]